MNSILSRHWRGISLHEDYEVTYKKRKQNTLGNFQGIGPLSTENHSEPYDLLEAFHAISAGARDRYLFLKERRDPTTNIVTVFTTTPVDHPKYKQRRRGANELFKRKLALQLKRPTIRELKLDAHPHFNENSAVYFLNPHYLRCREYKEAAMLWRELLKAYNISK